jgi:hypothetical protein
MSITTLRKNLLLKEGKKKLCTRDAMDVPEEYYSHSS